MSLSLATRSEDWLREISPIRKRGPVTVTNKENLRPISYVDDMQAVTEAAWLHQVKDKCWAYAGKQQAGVRYDAVIMVIALAIACNALSRALPT